MQAGYALLITSVEEAGFRRAALRARTGHQHVVASRQVLDAGEKRPRSGRANALSAEWSKPRRQLHMATRPLLYIANCVATSRAIAARNRQASERLTLNS